MQRAIAALLVLATVAAFQPSMFAAARQSGQIAGKAVVEGKPLPNISVRLRNVDTGQLAATTPVAIGARQAH